MLLTHLPTVRFIFWKHLGENVSFHNLILCEWGWKHVAQQICPAHRTLYIPQLLKTNLLSETVVSQAQPAFILFEFSSNNSIIMCQICSKLTIEASDIVMVSLMLILNIFDTCVVAFFANFEHVNARSNTLLP